MSVVEFFMWKNGKKWSFSEQELVDCSALNYGCSGGWPTYAFYHMRDFGITNGTRYTYKGIKQDCQREVRQYKPILKIPNVCEVFVNGSEVLLQQIIALYGPVAGSKTFWL